LRDFFQQRIPRRGVGASGNRSAAEKNVRVIRCCSRSFSAGRRGLGKLASP